MAEATGVPPVQTRTPETPVGVGDEPRVGGSLVSQQGGPAASRGLEGQIIPPKRSKKKFILTAVLLAALGGGGWFGYGWWTHGRFVVSTDDAYVRADVTTVAAKVAGYVTAVPFANNAAVKAGDVVARIDDGDYKLAVAAARNKVETQQSTIERIQRQVEAQTAALGQARAQQTSAEAEQVRASADFSRAQTLAATDFGSKQRLDQTRSDRDRAVANVESAKAALASAEANIAVTQAQAQEAVHVLEELKTALAKSERDLSFTVVTAPVDGVIGNRAVEVGNYVQPGARLAALVPLGSVYVEANFKETQLARIQPGQKVEIEVDALPGRKLEGHVLSFAPASGSIFSLLPPENATGNFTKIVQRVPVRIGVPEDVARQGLLRPGLSVVANVWTKRDGEGPVSAAAAEPTRSAKAD
ncbi:hemolysin D [Alsobacter metallidurans]|uniref:Hemolysin D n=1 Tax=Alsobacter metallidurans TaxID=340221 RepID=A0A917I5H7_9HYPH|nr:HlyD family secretion protein [Alsobacter metallidurans]GGH11377.1 hemolysin D [Alsobacter metallidurans]